MTMVVFHPSTLAPFHTFVAHTRDLKIKPFLTDGPHAIERYARKQNFSSARDNGEPFVVLRCLLAGARAVAHAEHVRVPVRVVCDKSSLSLGIFPLLDVPRQILLLP